MNEEPVLYTRTIPKPDRIKLELSFSAPCFGMEVISRRRFGPKTRQQNAIQG